MKQKTQHVNTFDLNVITIVSLNVFSLVKARVKEMFRVAANNCMT